MTKYRKYFEEMIWANKDIFAKFSDIHDKYTSNPRENESEFNRIGSDIMDIIREWEGKLCRQSESSQYGKFSSNLADKFWEEIRKEFPNIDTVGVKS